MVNLGQKTLAQVFGALIVDDSGHEFVLDGEPSLVVAEFRGREFANIDFTDAHVSGATFHECTFARCDFREMHLDSVRFEGCRFEECDFSGATIVGVSFDSADLVSCSMNKILGEEISFVAARLLHTELASSHLSILQRDDEQDYWDCFSESRPETALDLADAEMRAVDFSHAIAVGVRFDRSLLVECDMDSTLLVNSSFAGSVLIDCDFRSAHLIPPGTFDSWVEYATGGGEWMTTLAWDDVRDAGHDTDFDSCGIDFTGMTQNGWENGGGTVWPPHFASGRPTASRGDQRPYWFD